MNSYELVVKAAMKQSIISSSSHLAQFFKVVQPLTSLLERTPQNGILLLAVSIF